MSAFIAQTAVVDPRAQLGRDVHIGHFSVIGPDVVIGDGCRLEEHVVVKGASTIGEDNHFFAGCVIGGFPQDVSYRETQTRVEIGDGNVFRENCTVNRGSEKEEGLTRIGDNNYFMTGTHVAHDCTLGDRIVIANNGMLGGHVHVANDVTLAGGVGVHHFASIGTLSFVGAMSCVLNDIPPFMIAEGHGAKPRCVNIVGLKRNDYPSGDIKALQDAFKLLYRSKVGVEPARREMMETGPIRPVIKRLFDALDQSGGGRHGRGRDRRRKVA